MAEVKLAPADAAWITAEAAARGYASADAFLADLVAAERDQATDAAELHALLDEALNDPRPPIPADEVFAELRQRYGFIAP